MSELSEQPSTTGGPLHSTFEADADMAELIAMFVEELPQRVGELTDAFDREDLKALRSLSHQLKGSAGGYGFDVITDAARKLEQAVRDEADLATLRRSMDELMSLCGRAALPGT